MKETLCKVHANLFAVFPAKENGANVIKRLIDAKLKNIKFNLERFLNIINSKDFIIFYAIITF